MGRLSIIIFGGFGSLTAGTDRNQRTPSCIRGWREIWWKGSGRAPQLS